MRIYESKMNPKELQKISKNYSTELASSIFFWIIAATLLIFLNIFIDFEGYSKYFMNISLGLFGLNFFIKFIKLIFFNKIRKDLSEQKKIKITLKVVDKKTSSYISGDFFHRVTYARLYFEDNPYIGSYQISGDEYIFMRVGDKVSVEFSKYGKWIIKAKVNSRNITFSDQYLLK